MGDGRFYWYYAIGTTDPEVYHGQCGTREQAIEEARANDGNEYGFVIVEADRSVPRCDVIDVDYLFERYEENNEECWGEDGANLDYTPEQRRDLENMLAETFTAWFDKHGIKREGFNFDVVRNQETFEPKHSAEAE